MADDAPQRIVAPSDEGGDPACWAHLFENGQPDDEDAEVAAAPPGESQR